MFSVEQWFELARLGHSSFGDVLASLGDGDLDSHEARETPWTSEWYHRLRARDWPARAFWPGLVEDAPCQDHDIVVAVDKNTSVTKYDPGAGVTVPWIAIEAKRWWVDEERERFEEDWRKLAKTRCKYQMWAIAMCGYANPRRDAAALDGLDQEIRKGPWSQGRRLEVALDPFAARWGSSPSTRYVTLAFWASER